MREVGKKVGIAVETTKEELEYLQNKKYYNILEDASNFYRFYLQNTYEGKDALAYLNKRHLSNDVIERFKIGLSGNDSDDLYKALIEKNHLPLDMMEVGLIRYNDNSYYDVFRRRILFPISDLNGQVVGFSGRIYLPNSNEAKYVNSSDNVIFKKSFLLYNYYEAREDIKSLDRVYLFEGFLDVIAAYRANVMNAVASMGTALTDGQANAIKRLTNNVVIVYDGDGPGIEATKRAIQILVNKDMNVNVVNLPDGLDPDDFINKYGKDKLNDLLLNKSVFAMEYLYNICKKDLIPNDIISMESFKNSVFTYLNYFKSNLVIETYIKKIANEINLSYESLFGDFRKTQFVPIYKQHPQPDQKPETKGLNKAEKIIKEKYDQLQKTLIKMAIDNPEHCDQIEDNLEIYVCEENRDIMYNIHQYYAVNKVIDIEEIKTRLQPSSTEIYNLILNMEVPKDVTRIEILFNELKKYPLETELIDLMKKDQKDTSDLNRALEIQRELKGFNKKE